MNINLRHRYDRILIGGSCGSLDLVDKLFAGGQWENLPPIVYACHITKETGVNHLCELLNKKLPLEVSIAEPGGKMANNHLYLSPAGYHILLEDSGTTFRYYDDGPYLSSKPSINLFFMSCCGHEAKKTLVILASGANNDGAEGMHALSLHGARCAIVDPDYCQFDDMPRAAMRECHEYELIPHGKERKWLQRILWTKI